MLPWLYMVSKVVAISLITLSTIVEHKYSLRTIAINPMYSGLCRSVEAVKGYFYQPRPWHEETKDVAAILDRIGYIESKDCEGDVICMIGRKAEGWKMIGKYYLLIVAKNVAKHIVNTRFDFTAFQSKLVHVALFLSGALVGFSCPLVSAQMKKNKLLRPLPDKKGQPEPFAEPHLLEQPSKISKLRAWFPKRKQPNNVSKLSIDKHEQQVFEQQFCELQSCEQPLRERPLCEQHLSPTTDEQLKPEPVWLAI